MSLVDGPASYRLGDGDDWTGVAVNAPLVTGDAFYSGVGGRAEIQLAPGTYVRFGPETQLDLVEVAADATQVSVPVGRAIVRLRQDPHARHVEIDSPSAAIVLERAGSYRVDVEPGGRTTVRIGRGEATVHVGKNRYELYPNTSAVIDGSLGRATYRPIANASDDDLDLWERERDDRVDASDSYQHVSSEIYGVEDLDENGVWEYHRGYGQLWRPNTVQAGWAPYRNGRWVWVAPWGWTWLDYAAWGWAPFHYGRWVWLNSAWYWAPGTLIARPLYSPALVGFYGYGAGYGYGVSVSAGLAGGYIGWTPLGWGEPCYPWWGGYGGIRVGYAWWGGWGGPRIVNNVVIKQKNIYNIHAKDVRHVNRRHPGGFTAVPRNGFGRGGRGVPIGERDRRAFRAVGGRVDVTPDRSSRRAVHPAREAVGRRARPGGSSERGGMRRAGLTDGAGGRGARPVRGTPGVGRGGDPGVRAPRASRGAEGTSASARTPPLRRSADGSRGAVATDRSGTRLRSSVVPRPPARTGLPSRAPSAPRRFARRSEPYVASRPSFGGSLGDARTSTRISATSSGRQSLSRRVAVSGGGSSARRGRERSPSPQRGSVSVSRRTMPSSPPVSRSGSGGGSLRSSLVGRSGARATTAPPSPSSARVSRPRRAVTPSSGTAGTSRRALGSSAGPSSSSSSAGRVRSASGGRSISAGARSASSGGGVARSGGLRSSGSGGRSLGGSRSFGGGGRSLGGSRSFGGGGRSLGGGRSFGGSRGGGASGGRVGVGRR